MPMSFNTTHGELSVALDAITALSTSRPVVPFIMCETPPTTITSTRTASAAHQTRRSRHQPGRVSGGCGG